MKLVYFHFLFVEIRSQIINMILNCIFYIEQKTMPLIKYKPNFDSVKICFTKTRYLKL